MAPPNSKSVATSAPDLSIGVGENVGLHPSGYIEPTPSDSQDGDHSRELIETMARFRASPIDFLREVSLHVSGTGWRSYDKVVGTKVYYPGFSEEMSAKVLRSPMLRNKVEELARRRVDVEEKEGLLSAMEVQKEKRRRELEMSLLLVAEEMTDKMICKMDSKGFLRGAYYFATQLLTRAYHQGIHVSSEEVLRLHAVAVDAAKKKQSIIFLPSHRSHIDYISMQIICYRLGLGLPTVVAGDNLNFPLVGPFLQHAGAMYIRRSFGDDQLYGTLVQAYIDTLLQGGYNFECFIEGGRSRTGKLLPPKFGILRFLLESLLSGRVQDAIVCPVSTQYDKVIEVDSYISELLGQPKKKENLSDFLSANSILSMKLGRVDVRFHEPWSLREFINDQFARYVDIPGRIPSPEDWDGEKKVRLLRTMGYKVLSNINDVSVVMPSALCGTVLLTLRGRGVGKSELIRRVDWLRERIISRGGRVAHFAGLPTEVVVERALDVLGPALVGVTPSLPEETYYAVDRFQLSFYRNMTIHLFILEALVCASLYTVVKQGGALESQQLTYPQLRDYVFFLSQLFRGEFIFPTQGLDANIEKALRSLESDTVITITRSPDGSKIASIELSAQERDSGRENYDFYCFLIWPFIEASWLGAISLLILTPPPGHKGDLWLDMKKVQDQAQLLGKTLYHQGDLSYFEAVNKETLKNAYTRFEEEGIILVTKSRDARVPATVRLSDDWLPSRDPETGLLLPEGKLWTFADMISQSRREGKNRRDGKTVSSRVLRLVDLVAGRLYEETVAKKVGKDKVDATPTEQDAEAAKRKGRRRKIVGRGARL